MTYQNIVDTYLKMGLGTQEERNQFLQWCPETTPQNNKFVFIIEAPNSGKSMETEKLKEVENAQLA